MPNTAPTPTPCEFHGDDHAACKQYSGTIPCSPDWTHDKPTQPGAYWIRGNGLSRAALIQVIEDEGELCCNLHMHTTDSDFSYGYTIEQLDDEFEYLGPLVPSTSMTVARPMPKGWRDVIERVREAIGAGANGIQAEGERSIVGPYLDVIGDELEALERQEHA
jgi:hypothetical protein